jgi:hypothetical protein
MTVSVALTAVMNTSRDESYNILAQEFTGVNTRLKCCLLQDIEAEGSKSQ